MTGIQNKLFPYLVYIKLDVTENNKMAYLRYRVIFKKGDKSQPSNNRPVALLSCIGKLQESIFKNMYNFLIENDLLYKKQSGF